MSLRTLQKRTIECDLTITGGGLAGVCAAITAARLGLRVVLIQDRPVLGGNSSSEIRLWALGATCYGRSHNRYSRESGVMGELFIENRYRNPEGNPVIWDTILLEWVHRESNITLLLDTAVYDVTMDSDYPNRIRSVHAFSALNQTEYEVRSPLFLDSSGDGIVGYLSGAEFQMGREAEQTYRERFAPPQDDRRLLGCSIYFMSKDTGEPVRFIRPDYALDLAETDIPKFRRIRSEENGPEFWWIEYGGLMDTIHEAYSIKWELWRIVYGVWDYIKNSGHCANTENLTLEWVGLIPGKRESRRFIGDYVLTQSDITEQRRFSDAVAVGGWPIDLHPAEGVFSCENACTQEHPDGVYTIPYRCYYSKNIENLFLAGRIISASHVAFGSARVMATCAVGGQVVGAAAYLCRMASLTPRQLSGDGAESLQNLLLRENQDIHWLRGEDPVNIARTANVASSTCRKLSGFSIKSGSTYSIDDDFALMFPVTEGRLDRITVPIAAERDTCVSVSIWINDKKMNYIPNCKLWEETISIPKSESYNLVIPADLRFKEPLFVWVIVKKNEDISFFQSSDQAVGVIAKKPERPRELHHQYVGQLIWKPRKVNVAFSIEPAQDCYQPGNVINGYSRPLQTPNCWSSERFKDGEPEWILLRWDSPQTITQIDVICNADWDNPLETLFTRHRDRTLEEILRDVDIEIQDPDGSWRAIQRVRGNHHTMIRTCIEPEVVKAVRVTCLAANEEYPFAEIFDIRVYTAGCDVYWKKAAQIQSANGNAE